mmetsp:Transcript_39257/g.104190  ORF Transcript_39257/g.104190 Transcript_39257/m.104190 type:complete len:250 (+) Transcript_39257:337-1086(+)
MAVFILFCNFLLAVVVVIFILQFLEHRLERARCRGLGAVLFAVWRPHGVRFPRHPFYPSRVSASSVEASGSFVTRRVSCLGACFKMFFQVRVFWLRITLQVVHVRIDLSDLGRTVRLRNRRRDVRSAIVLGNSRSTVRRFLRMCAGNRVCAVGSAVKIVAGTGGHNDMFFVPLAAFSCVKSGACWASRLGVCGGLHGAMCVMFLLVRSLAVNIAFQTVHHWRLASLIPVFWWRCRFTGVRPYLFHRCLR